MKDIHNKDRPLKPKTTAQEDLTTSGQRRINMIWEVTQAIIAVTITLAVVYMSINKTESTVLVNAFFLIVSMYFVRTNHTKIGGTNSSVQQIGR